MKQFHFPLDRVRRWRREQATLEELKLEQLVEHLTKLGQEKRGIESARMHSEEEVLGQPSIEATELQSLEAYCLHTRNKIHEIENLERQAGAAAEQQRQRVIEARRQAELIERLKQKAFAEWQAASNREQENLAGELYLAKLARRR
jgi:flagellar export protein FliJ